MFQNPNRASAIDYQPPPRSTNNTPVTQTHASPRGRVPIHLRVHSTMAGYHQEGPKAARMYEVILPKKLGYFGKVQQVLEDLFSELAIRKVPYVQREITRSQKRDPNFDVDRWVHTLCNATRGYSIYEMDGRYLGPTGAAIDERVLVIRFIFHDVNGIPNMMKASQEIVNHLVAHRFAEELGVEDEIWFLEYTNTQLAIWRKDR